MSKKEKLEKDYREASLRVEQLAQEEIAEIQRKMDAIKREAEKTGAEVERKLGGEKGEGKKS
jgi:hypothetical protein